MNRPKRIALFTVITVLLASCALWILNSKIRADRQARERHFIAAHFVATEAMFDTDRDRPPTFHGLLDPFPDGLVYRVVDGGFELAEPRPRFVSLFRRDRLIATNLAWPHWEASGKDAQKGFEIP